MNISHSKTASTAPVLSAPAWSSKQQQQHSQHRMSAQELQLRGMPAPGEGWDDQQGWLLHQLKSHQQQQVQHVRVICLVQQGYTVYWQRVQCNVRFMLVFVMFSSASAQHNKGGGAGHDKAPIWVGTGNMCPPRAEVFQSNQSR